MKPKPWSHSALEQFKNCPRQYHEVRVAKSVVDVQGKEAAWGNEVHKHFEDFLGDGVVLPAMLQMHEGFLTRLLELPGEGFVERAIGISVSGQPCEFFADDVWYRGKIDYLKIHGSQALIIDHKTGKMKTKFEQLMIFALWVFLTYPDVETVRAEYYWTQLRSKNGDTFSRSQIPAMWDKFLPDLRQFAQAFREDIWQPRQSGLCNGWCPVTECEFWKPKRSGR